MSSSTVAISFSFHNMVQQSFTAFLHVTPGSVEVSRIPRVGDLAPRPVSIVEQKADLSAGITAGDPFCIPDIIVICKEKTELLRKNAAVLLAKFARSSPENEQYVRDLHGMEVLLSVSGYIK